MARVNAPNGFRHSGIGRMCGKMMVASDEAGPAGNRALTTSPAKES